MSISTSPPSSFSCTSLPKSRDRSRTSRGNLLNRLPTGCMRVSVTTSCSSEVTRLTRWAPERMPRSSCRASDSFNWLRLSTSSPASVIRESSKVTFSRMVVSLAGTGVAAAALGASSTGVVAGAERGAGVASTSGATGAEVAGSAAAGTGSARGLMRAVLLDQPHSLRRHIHQPFQQVRLQHGGI